LEDFYPVFYLHSRESGGVRFFLLIENIIIFFWINLFYFRKQDCNILTFRLCAFKNWKSVIYNKWYISLNLTGAHMQ
jgi:hypothetical protein